jgi:recombination protein RecT
MNTAVATKQKTIQDIIRHDMAAQFALALPSVCTPDRFVRVALTTINKTPKLAQCTQGSLLACLMDCASLGLEPDGRRAHLIPYGDKCTLIIDYKGLIELARRSGEVSNWRAEVVCDFDKFSFKNGVVEHEIDFRSDRGAPFAVYSECKFKDGTIDYEVMTIAEIDAIRKRSRAGNDGPWKTDYLEMAKKTVIRRHSKRLPLSAEFRDALEKDQDAPIDISTMKIAEVDATIVDKLKGGKAEIPAAVQETTAPATDIPE